jgi:hypothetical protein
MEHALIIGGDSHSVGSLKESLWDSGYRSVLAVSDIPEAWNMVRVLHPAPIVVVPDSAWISPTWELYEMSKAAGAPIIVATADPETALRCLGAGATLEGPYDVGSLAAARDAALSPPPWLAQAA